MQSYTFNVIFVSFVAFLLMRLSKLKAMGGEHTILCTDDVVWDLCI